MTQPAASTVGVQLHACGRLVIVRAPGQKPLHLDRDGARRMAELLSDALPNMVGNAPTAPATHPLLPHTS